MTIEGNKADGKAARGENGANGESVYRGSRMNGEPAPGLYLCATPIGNLEDITLRVIRTLKSVDRVYCEDTRNTLKLLNHLGIKKPLISCREHNERQRAEEIAEQVSRGKAIAFVSDAGMPAVSDPGSRLIRLFIERNLPFEVLPGACAAVTAWVLSGLPTDSLYFCGFLPRGGAERKEAIEKLRTVPATAVIYESPLRVGATLGELYAALGERQCALIREMTKLYEEVIRGALSELAEKYAAAPPKGECAIALGAAEKEKADGKKIYGLIFMLLKNNVNIKNIAKIVSSVYGIPKNDAYELAVRLKASEANTEE